MGESAPSISLSMNIHWAGNIVEHLIVAFKIKAFFKKNFNKSER